MMISLITRLGNLILMLNSSNFCSGYSLQSFGERHILHLQPGIRAVSSLGFLPECPWSGTDKYWTGVSHFSSSSTSSLLRQILLLERSKGDHPIQISRSPPRNQMPVNGENRLGEKPWSSPLWGIQEFHKAAFSSHRNSRVPNKAFNFDKVPWTSFKCIAVPSRVCYWKLSHSFTVIEN